MEIIGLNRSDDDLVEQVWSVARRSDEASRVQPVRESLAEFAADLRFVKPGEHDEVLVAIVGDKVVGGARVWFTERDNTDKCWFMVFVDPGSRRRGVGAALVDRVEATARAERRATGLTEVFIPVGERVEHAAARFAVRCGYTVFDTEIVRGLSLPLNSARRDALEQRAAQGVGRGYRVDVYRGGAPEALQRGVCDIANRLVVDAPTGDLEFQAESMTPDDYRHHLEYESSIGRARLTAIAIEGTTGDVVAYSDLVLPQGDPAAAIQWGTFVAQEHRGHRLGLAVKTANLRELALVDPGRTHVETMNAEANPWMVQINVDLGFEVIEEALMLRKDL